MTLQTAQQLAQRCANRTGSSTLVYQDTHKNDGVLRYDFDFTLPTFGIRVGERIYPQDAATQTQCEDANRNAVLNRTASEYGNDEIRWPDGLQHY